METIKNEQIYAFDSLYTTNHIQMLKILLPCLSPPLQKNLALYIKFLELRYTISFLNAHPYVLSGCGFDNKYADQEIPVNDLLPYLTPKEAENFQQFRRSMDMMKQFSNMQKNMEALKGILPEGMDFETLFGQMMNDSPSGGNECTGTKADKGNSSAYPAENDGISAEDSSKTEKKSFSSVPNDFLQNMMKGSSSGDILKNMMSDSQKELYEKFNERFQNL